MRRCAPRVAVFRLCAAVSSRAACPPPSRATGAPGPGRSVRLWGGYLPAASLDVLDSARSAAAAPAGQRGGSARNAMACFMVAQWGERVVRRRLRRRQRWR
eukprot:gene11478-biopygen1733